MQKSTRRRSSRTKFVFRVNLLLPTAPWAGPAGDIRRITTLPRKTVERLGVAYVKLLWQFLTYQYNKRTVGESHRLELSDSKLGFLQLHRNT